jgi:hypothetical protein
LFIAFDLGVLDKCVPSQLTLQSAYRRQNKRLRYGDLLALLAFLTTAAMVAQAIDLHAWSGYIPFEAYTVLGDLGSVSALVITLVIVERCLTAAYVISHPLAQMKLVSRPLRSGMRQLSATVFVSIFILSALSVTVRVPGAGYVNGSINAAKVLLIAVFLLVSSFLGSYKTWRAVQQLARAGSFSLLDSREAVLVVNSQICVLVASLAAIVWCILTAQSQLLRTIRVAPPCHLGDAAKLEPATYFQFVAVLGVCAGWKRSRVLRRDLAANLALSPSNGPRARAHRRHRHSSWVSDLVRALDLGEGVPHRYDTTPRSSSLSYPHSHLSRTSFGSSTVRLSLDGMLAQLAVGGGAALGPTPSGVVSLQLKDIQHESATEPPTQPEPDIQSPPEILSPQERLAELSRVSEEGFTESNME